MFLILKNGFLASKQSLIQLFVLFFLAFIGAGAISLLGNSYKSMNDSYNQLVAETNIYDYSVGLASGSPVKIKDENKVYENFGNACPKFDAGCLFDAGLRKFNDTNKGKNHLVWNTGFANLVTDQINNENMLILNYFERSDQKDNLEIAQGVKLKNANSTFDNMNQPYVVEGKFNYADLEEDQIFITSEYAKLNNLHPGDTYNFLGTQKTIVGTGIIPEFNVFRSSYNSVIPNYKIDNMVILNYRETIKYQSKIILPIFTYDDLNKQNINYYGLATTGFFGSYFVKNTGLEIAKANEISTFFNERGLSIDVDESSFLSDGSYGRWITENQFNLFIIIEVLSCLSLVGILLYITILVTRSLLVKFLNIFGILKSNGYSARKISLSFVPLLFTVLLFSSTLGNVIAFYLQSTVYDAFATIIQFPNLVSKINVFTLLYSVGLPFFVALVSYFYCLLYLKKNIFDLFGSSKGTKSGFLVTKIGKIVSSPKIPFSVKIRTKMALNQVWKIVLFGTTVTVGGFLTLFGTVISTSIDSFVNKTFEVRNYNYSYSVNSDFVDGRSANDELQIDSLENIKKDENRIDSFDELQKSYTNKTMGGKWIPCKPDDSESSCWFETLPEYNPVLGPNLAKFISQIKTLFPRLPKSNKYNPDGTILINRLAYEKSTDVVGYEGIIGNLEQTDSYIISRGVSQEVAEVDGTVNVDGNSVMQNMIDNKNDYEWNGDFNVPIKVASSALFNILYDFEIGDTFSVNISQDKKNPKIVNFLITDSTQDIATPKIFTLQETLIKIFAEKYNISNDEVKPNILYAQSNILDTQLPIYYDAGDDIYTTDIWGTPIENSEQNLASIKKLNSVLTQILLAISVLTISAALLVIFLICYVTIRENVKYIAMMNILGYNKSRLLTLFVGVYIPIVIIATAIALPSAYVAAYAVAHLVNSVAGDASTFKLLIEFVPNQLIAVILGIITVFGFCWLMSWIAIKRTSSLQIIENSE